VRKLNILDLFSGIGGFSLAAQRAGFQIEKHYASEIDKYARMIYRRNFNGSIQLGDVTKIRNDLEKIDIITGGFPCQAFSIAGKRGGFGDTRGTLFFEIERLAEIYQPAYMVLENVKGLFSHEKGNTIRIILDKLRGLSYAVQLLLVNSKDFGVPQNRERIFFICTAPGKCQPKISGIRERKTEIVTEQIISIPVLSPDRVEKRQNGRRFKENGEPSFTLTAQDRHGVYTGEIIRRLTPVECERLQDYPDNWTKYGIDENGKEVEISDTQRYKTCGNSITVKVAEEIFKEIYKVIDF